MGSRFQPAMDVSPYQQDDGFTLDNLNAHFRHVGAGRLLEFTLSIMTPAEQIFVVCSVLSKTSRPVALIERSF
jgi:hypothetical protein